MKDYKSLLLRNVNRSIGPLGSGLLISLEGFFKDEQLLCQCSDLEGYQDGVRACDLVEDCPASTG